VAKKLTDNMGAIVNLVVKTYTEKCFSLQSNLQICIYISQFSAFVQVCNFATTGMNIRRKVKKVIRTENYLVQKSPYIQVFSKCSHMRPVWVPLGTRHMPHLLAFLYHTQ
jgi:hypothetical protein